jgi:hypothetical protein
LRKPEVSLLAVCIAHPDTQSLLVTCYRSITNTEALAAYAKLAGVAVTPWRLAK